MNEQIFQNLRYKLQKRFRRLNAVEKSNFPYILRQFWQFLHSYPIFQGILEYLEYLDCSQEQKENADKIVNPINRHQKHIIFGETELEQYAFAYFTIKKFCESSQNEIYLENIGSLYAEGKSTRQDWIDSFITHFVEPLYEYIDESLDDNRAILALLNRYKHRCEWFHRERLLKIWQDNTQNGEKNLALDLYEYLFNEGLYHLHLVATQIKHSQYNPNLLKTG